MPSFSAIRFATAAPECKAPFHEAHERVAGVLAGEVQPADAVVEGRSLRGDLPRRRERVRALRPGIRRPVHEPRPHEARGDAAIDLVQLREVVAIPLRGGPLAADIGRRSARERDQRFAGALLAVGAVPRHRHRTVGEQIRRQLAAPPDRRLQRHQVLDVRAHLRRQRRRQHRVDGDLVPHARRRRQQHVLGLEHLAVAERDARRACRSSRSTAPACGS